MADDIESQLAALEAKAPVTPETGDPGFVEEAPQSAAQPDQQQQQDKPAEAAQGAADPQQAQQAKDELPLEEIKKRWEDQKGATAKERQERRAAIARAEAAEARAAQNEQRLAALVAQLQAGANKAPDPEEDVVGALKHTQQQLALAQQHEMQRRQQMAVVEQQNAFVNRLKAKVADFEAEFAEAHPDYEERSEFLLDGEEARLMDIGYTKEQAREAAANFAMNAALKALQEGKNPAEIVYKLSDRMGFKPRGEAPAANGAQPDAAALAAQQKAAAEAAAKIAQVRDGQRATSPMAGGGNSNQFDGSLKAGLQLEGAAFDAWQEKFLRTQTRG